MYETISETVDAYNAALNADYSGMTVAGVIYDYSDILEALDPKDYKLGWIEWCGSEGIDPDELEDDYTFECDKW